MAKNTPQLTLTLVAANDNRDPKTERDPVDPRLVSLARILARQATLAMFTSDHHSANDNDIPPNQEDMP